MKQLKMNGKGDIMGKNSLSCFFPVVFNVFENVKLKTAVDDTASSSLKRFGLTNCNKLHNKCIILVSVKIEWC